MPRFLLALLVSSLAFGCSKPNAAKPVVGEIAPDAVLAERYGLSCEKRPTITLAPERVPTSLVDLIPLAQRWGISDDIIRSDCITRASEAEKDELANTLRGRTGEVTRWLDQRQPNKTLTAEQAAFMYMLNALDTMGRWPDREPDNK